MSSRQRSIMPCLRRDRTTTKKRPPNVSGAGTTSGDLSLRQLITHARAHRSRETPLKRYNENRVEYAWRRLTAKKLGAGRRRGKGEVERRALVRLPFRPDPPAVAVDDALGEGEPHARPLELLYVVQPLEHTEQLVLAAPIEPGAVVVHVVDDGVAFPARGDVHPRMRAIAAELESVADQVDQHLAQQRCVSRGRGQRLYRDLHGDAPRGAPQLVH